MTESRITFNADAPPYANEPMTRERAQSIVIDAGLVLSDRDEGGTPIKRTCRLDLMASGEGFDVRMPVEHLAKLAAVNYAEGRSDALCTKNN